MAKRTIKINLKLPAGMTATNSLISEATNAAKNVVESASSNVIEAQKIAKDMAKRGVNMTAEEVLTRMGGAKPKQTAKKGAKKGARKRVVLTDAQRKSLVEDLKAGIKIKDAEKKYGVSQATVTNIKKAHGLTKPKR
jgi:hypothetical protein